MNHNYGDRDDDDGDDAELGARPVLTLTLDNSYCQTNVLSEH